MVNTAVAVPPRRAPPPKRDYLSFSSISTYQVCPLKYYFKYVAGLPEQVISSSLVFGKAVHRAVEFYFEQHLAGAELPTLDGLLGVYQTEWNKVPPLQRIVFGKEDDQDSLSLLADKVLKAFLVSNLAQPEGVIIGVEEELRGPVIPGCPELLARVDLMVETKAELVVTDFKTSRRSWSIDQVFDAAPQLVLYGELVQKLTDKPIRLQFGVFTKTKQPEITVFPFKVDPHLTLRTKRTVERVWKAIQSQHFYPTPSPMNCPSCPFRGPCLKWTG
jgi:CRISPR/Cas system-associated exonuclease Cas4 (RecB family)